MILAVLRVSAWLWFGCSELSFSFFFLKLQTHRQRSESPKFTHKSTHRRIHAHTRVQIHLYEQTERLYLQYTQHQRVCVQSRKTSRRHLPDGSSGGSKSLNIIKTNTWYKMRGGQRLLDSCQYPCRLPSTGPDYCFSHMWHKLHFLTGRENLEALNYGFSPSLG